MHDNNTVTAFYQQYVSCFPIVDLLFQCKIMNIVAKKVMFKMNKRLFACYAFHYLETNKSCLCVSLSVPV